MGIKVVHALKNAPSTMVSMIRDQLTNFEVKTLVYFASSVVDFEEIGKLLKETYPTATLFGCTSYSEMATKHNLKESVVAMAFDDELIEDVHIEVIEGLKTRGEEKVEHAFHQFETYYSQKANEFHYKEYLGFVFMDFVPAVEEQIMQKISGLTNVFFVGGSAADNHQFVSSSVFANGVTYEDAAVLVLMKTKLPFEVIKTQSFKVLNKTLVPTKVNNETRTILEIDGKPAIEGYADAIGVPKEDVVEKFFNYPLGVVAGEEIFVRSPGQLKEEGAIYMACNVIEGDTLHLLESTDIIAETKEAIAHIENPKALIQINCMYRCLELQQKELMDEYTALFNHIPNIGFTSYGEAFLGHINQTAVLIVFKGK